MNRHKMVTGGETPNDELIFNTYHEADHENTVNAYSTKSRCVKRASCVGSVGLVGVLTFGLLGDTEVIVGRSLKGAV
jgi:hypothetical protein